MFLWAHGHKTKPQNCLFQPKPSHFCYNALRARPRAKKLNSLVVWTSRNPLALAFIPTTFNIHLIDIGILNLCQISGRLIYVNLCWPCTSHDTSFQTTNQWFINVKAPKSKLESYFTASFCFCKFKFWLVFREPKANFRQGVREHTKSVKTQAKM